MNVIVYSTASCPWCHKTKDYFTENGIQFTDYNVETDAVKAQEMVDKSGQMSVPVIDIEGEITVGFDKARLDQLLKIA